MSEKQRKVVESIASDKLLMFNYAAGVISDEAVSLENCAKLTGISLAVLEKKEYDFPTLCVAEGALDVLLRDEEGNARVARKMGGNKIMNTKPYLSAKELRAVTDLAGCHAYTPVGNIVYGDSRFLGVFTGKEKGLTDPIVMKEKETYRDLISGTCFVSQKELSHPLSSESAAFFLKEE